MNSVKLSAKFLFILLSFLSTATFFNKKPFISLAETEHSKAECVMEKESRRILYEYNGDRRLPIASTTKIATAITVLEECECLEEKFHTIKNGKGIAFCVPLSSVIGVNIYQFLSNYKKED